MAGYCSGFLFYSYAAATVIYLIYGSFAATGNIALLTEHYHFEKANEISEDEVKDVKARTTMQYFFAAGACLLISVALYVFCMREGYKPIEEKKYVRSISLDMKEAQSNNIIDNQNQNNNNIEIPVQDNDENNKLNAINTINTLSSGMGEKDDL